MERSRYLIMVELQSYCYFLVIYLLTKVPLSDAIFMWTAPPPAWNQTNPGIANIQTAVTEAINGSSNVTLKWNYTLLDGQDIDFTYFAIGDGVSQPDDIGFVLNGISSLNDRNDYRARFSIGSTNEYSTVILKTVSERENATFQCRIQVGSDTWAYNVRVEVTVPAGITDISGNQTVSPSETVHLNCSATGHPAPGISWIKVSDNNVVTFPLTISGVKDEGAYRCTASNGIGNPASRDVFITVQNYSPINTNLTTNLKADNIVAVDSNFTLICSARADPPAKYRFYIGQESLFNTTTGSNIAVYTTSINEKINQVNFSCTPFNEYGEGPTEFITLLVKYLPSTSNLTSVPKNTTVLRGNTVSLICSTEANPDAHVYQFYVNGIFIGNSSSGVFNVTVEADGVYTCVPINTVGTGHNATVNITAVDATSVKIETTANTVIEGNNISLFCNASGKPEPTITWIRVGSLEVLSNTPSLTVVNVSRPGTPDHTIQYQCTASNGVESPAIAVANISVLYLPSTSILTTVPNNTTVLRGNTVSLICSTKANPDAHVYQFFVNGILIGNSSSVLFNVTVETDGVYTCVPINTVGTGHDASINITAVDASSVIIEKTADTVIEGNNISFFCNASGKPEPTITWIRFGSSEVLSNTPSLAVMNVRRPGTPDNVIQYQCTASNGVGRPASAFSNITVHYRPSTSSLTNVPSNTKVLRGNTVSLICSTDASPNAHVYQFYFNDTIIGNSSSGVLNVTVDADGVYTCVPINIIGTGHNATVSITVVVPPSVNVYPASATVVKGNSITLSCNASGKPEPSISWTKVGASDQVLSQHSSLTVNLGSPENADNMIRYQCSASNGVGSPAVDTAEITVRYSPEIVKPQTATWEIMAGASVTIECLAKGNPSPQYVWTNSASGVVRNDRYLDLRDISDSHGGIYTCTALNNLGSDNFVMLVKVTREELQLEVTVVQENGAKAIYRSDYENINSAPAKAFAESFAKEVNKVYQNKTSFNRVQVTALRKGSVIVSFLLLFTTPVTTDEGIFELKDAVDKGTIGPYTVRVLKIIQHRDPTTVATTTSTAPEPRGENTTKATPDSECRSCYDTIYRGIIGALVLVIILMVIILLLFYKRKTTAKNEERPKTEGQPYDHGGYNNIAMQDIGPTQRGPSNSIQEDTLSCSGYKGKQEATRSRSNPTEQTSPSITQPQSSAQGAVYTPLHPSTRSWEVARTQVNIEKIIGNGTFGQVAKGTALDLWGRTGKTTVAVKMLKDTAPESDMKDLLSELEVMKTLKPHRHVIKLLGCVTKSEPIWVLIEYVPYGDLLGYLRKSRGLNDTYYKDPDIKPQTSLTSQQLMKFAWQIADGMSYLSSRSIIHRDLAARNVLVGEEEICKVTDFGMARDVQQENDIYEKKTTDRRLPVKWTAYEALLHGTFTTKSDVWSYGVVLYEIFTIGGSPYPQKNNKEVTNLLERGCRMPKPKHVDEELYQIMLNCWKNEPELRPSFDALTKQLKDKENQHKRLINMHIYENELYEVVDDLNV